MCFIYRANEQQNVDQVTIRLRQFVRNAFQVERRLTAEMRRRGGMDDLVMRRLHLQMTRTANFVSSLQRHLRQHTAEDEERIEAARNHLNGQLRRNAQQLDNDAGSEDDEDKENCEP